LTTKASQFGAASETVTDNEKAKRVYTKRINYIIDNHRCTWSNYRKLTIMKQSLLAIILLLTSVNAHAIDFTLFGGESEFSLAGGPDVHKDKGDRYAEIRYRETLSENGFLGLGVGDRFGYSLYAGEHNTYGADIFQTWGRFMFGFGIEAADNNEEVVQSTAGYELLFEWAITEHWAASLKHRSNCRQICGGVPDYVPIIGQLPHGSDDKTNGGYNWLMLRYTF
jgi:hypothetical protein